MENMPNAYQIKYEVYEGDNYAGGIAIHTKYVFSNISEELLKIGYISIKEVSPVYIETFPPMVMADVKHIMKVALDDRRENEKKAEIAKLEAKLNDLRARIIS